MKFSTPSLLALMNASISANPNCTPSPKVMPKLEYDFTINLVFAPSIESGDINISNGQLTYLSTTGGTFCAKWNGGVSGAVVPGGTATFLQVQNGTGPYKLNLEYLLKTNDKHPAYILVKQTGWEVSFVGRTNYAMETGDSRYSAVNTGVSIGVETSFVSNATGVFSSVNGYRVPA